MVMTEAFLCDAVRTPIGRYGGALAGVRADDLGALPIRTLIARNPTLDPAAIEEVFLGCANQAGEDNRNVARMSLLLAGLRETVPGVTLNRLCASELEAVGQAARAVRTRPRHPPFMPRRSCRRRSPTRRLARAASNEMSTSGPVPRRPSRLSLARASGLRPPATPSPRESFVLHQS